ncbi:MAG: hypothetical protein WCG83_03105 [Candidatus Peregrinibacteria bacterium]
MKNFDTDSPNNLADLVDDLAEIIKDKGEKRAEALRIVMEVLGVLRTQMGPILSLIHDQSFDEFRVYLLRVLEAKTADHQRNSQDSTICNQQELATVFVQWMQRRRAQNFNNWLMQSSVHNGGEAGGTTRQLGQNDDSLHLLRDFTDGNISRFGLSTKQQRRIVKDFCREIGLKPRQFRQISRDDKPLNK